MYSHTTQFAQKEDIAVQYEGENSSQQYRDRLYVNRAATLSKGLSLDAATAHALRYRAEKCDAALTPLIHSCLLMVVKIARRLENKFGLRGEIEISDLIQTGNFALVVAARDYRPDAGIKFATFAWIVVRNAIIQALFGKKQDAYTHADALETLPFDPAVEFLERNPTPLLVDGFRECVREYQSVTEMLDAFVRVLRTLPPRNEQGAQRVLIRYGLHDGSYEKRSLEVVGSVTGEVSKAAVSQSISGVWKALEACRHTVRSHESLAQLLERKVALNALFEVEYPSSH